jgi:hypothetical protein
MSRLFTRSFTFLVFLAVGSASTAKAQAVQQVRANIPFEFNLAGRAFPAGNYTFVEDFQHLVQLRDSRGRNLARVYTVGVESNHPANGNKLKFELIAGQHTLIELWLDQNSSGERFLSPIRHLSLAKFHGVDDQKASPGGQP